MFVRNVCIKLILKKPEQWLTSPRCKHNHVIQQEPDGCSRRGGFYHVALQVFAGDGRKAEKAIQSIVFSDLRRSHCSGFYRLELNTYLEKKIKLCSFFHLLGFNDDRRLLLQQQVLVL